MTYEVIDFPTEFITLPLKVKNLRPDALHRAEVRGVIDPVLIDELGGVLAGVTRTMAAKRLGFPTVPTITMIGVSELERKELAKRDIVLARDDKPWTPAEVEFTMERAAFLEGKTPQQVTALVREKVFIPTEAQREHVKIMVACGMTQENIRLEMHNSRTNIVPTYAAFVEAFKEEIASGKNIANANVANSLYRKAIGEGKSSVAAAIFWLKTQAGWKDPDAASRYGGPSTLNTIILPDDPIEAQKAYRRLIEGG